MENPGNTRKIRCTKPVCPEQPSQQDEEDYFDSEEMWEWRRKAWEKYEASMAAQGSGMDACYAMILRQMLVTDSSRNTVCSPLNVFIALSMLAEITGGETRAQILRTLRAENMEQLRTFVKALWEANYADTTGVKSLLSNSLWLRDDFPYRDETIRELAENFYTSVYEGVMGSNEMNEALRRWTDESTGGLLKQYTQGLQFSPADMVVLISAIYFKDSWMNNFDRSKTKEEVFHGAEKETKVKMMKKSGSDICFGGDRFTAVSLGLAGGSRVYFFLPDEGTDVRQLVTDPQVMRLLRTGSAQVEKEMLIHLSVPKFKIQAQTDLTETLRNLGITDVMDPEKADFLPLSEQSRGAFLGRARHAAVVGIDEDGLTGAAYVEVCLAGCACFEELEEINFVLDRPFFFAVIAPDRSPLFAGIVQNVD